MFPLLLLVGFGLVVLAQKGGLTHATGALPAPPPPKDTPGGTPPAGGGGTPTSTPPVPSGKLPGSDVLAPAPVASTRTTDSGLVVTTSAGLRLLQTRLRRYGTPIVKVAMPGGGLYTAGIVEMGTLIVPPPGVPLTSGDLAGTAAGWVFDQALAGKWVLVRAAFATISDNGLELKAKNPALPDTVDLMAVDNPGGPAIITLGSAAAPGAGWVVLTEAADL